MHSYPPTHDSQRARLSRFLSPGFSYCGRCGFPWSKVKGHTTWYTRNSGVFTLCEKCFDSVDVEEALTYYKRLSDEHGNWTEDRWRDTMEAVHREKGSTYE